MPGKRHMAKDTCRKCQGCGAGRLFCRFGHVICWCRVYVIGGVGQ